MAGAADGDPAEGAGTEEAGNAVLRRAERNEAAEAGAAGAGGGIGGGLGSIQALGGIRRSQRGAGREPRPQAQRAGGGALPLPE